MSKFNLDYFIRKFSRIPRNKWTKGTFHSHGRSCALGHCGEGKWVDGGSAGKLLQLAPNIIMANDKGYLVKRTPEGLERTYLSGTSIKERVINYLKSLR